MRVLVEALEHAQSTRSKKAKAEALAEALRDAASRSASDLATCARLVLGRPLSPTDGRSLGVGWSLILAAAVRAWGLDSHAIVTKTREVGDLGDAIAALLDGSVGPGLAMNEARALFDALADEPSRDRKEALLVDALARSRPIEAKYLVKAITGELRVGAREGVLEDAIARAFGRTGAEVRRASGIVTDPGELACRAHQGTLAEARICLGVPVAFMLATPIESLASPVEATVTWVEDKLDGVRAQAHAAPGFARLFARGQGDVTRVFPEIARALERIMGPVILDGEILAVDTAGRPRPFQALQARLGRVSPTDELCSEVPVRFFAFDILFDGEPLIDVAWSTRRARLERLAAEGAADLPWCVHAARPLDASTTIDETLGAEFEAARARGNEGLVLKRADSAYEAGRRGGAWRKVKRELATLDVVVTAVERGHGKRAGVLSDYTFAVWEGDALVDIGKAYSGLTDAEIAALTERFIEMTVETRGGWHRVRPEVVLEVAFDGLQRSERHASGLALRFPRIARVRDDKSPREADTLDAARALLRAQIESGHREEESPAQARGPKKKRRGAEVKAGRGARKDPRQLSLFGEEKE